MTSGRMRIAALGAAAFALTGLAVAAPAAATSPPPTAAACDKTPWEPDVQGRNANYHPGAPGGDYLWHNRRGFHLGVTHGNTHRDRVFSGVVHSTKPMWIDRVRLEKGDVVRLSHNRRSLVFIFANHGWVDAVGFHTGCAQSVTVRDLHVGSNRLPASRVFLGKDGAHPAQVPFTLHRVPTPAS